MELNFTKGKGRTRVDLQAASMGDGLVVRIFNENAHIGAVSIGEYDFTNQRASVSVMTRLGHKDDSIAQKASYTICKMTRKTVCVVVGVHVDNITQDEIVQITENARYLIEELIGNLGKLT
jgi:gallate decarboxylase subunit D